MIAVIFVLSLVAAIAIPNMAASIEGQRRRDFMTGLPRLVVQAREQAISLGSPVELRFNGSSFVIERPAAEGEEPQTVGAVRVAQGVSVEKTFLSSEEVSDEDWVVQFYPDGTCDSATIELSEGNDSRAFVINPRQGKGRYMGSDEAQQLGDDRWIAGDELG